MSEAVEPIIIVVTRSEVERRDTSIVMKPLGDLMRSPERARSFRERIDIAIDGYNEDPRELFEIDEVRAFVRELDGHFPYWLYFLSKEYTGLQCVTLCLLPPFLTREGKQKHFPAKLQEILEKRWQPALEKICSFAGVPESELLEIIERSARYLSDGPLGPH